MAEQVKTAQDFRKQNECIDNAKKEAAKSRVYDEWVPMFTKKVNEQYALNQLTERIFLTETGSMNNYEIHFVEEWARSLGYKPDITGQELSLLIPHEESETEKYEDS